MRLNSLHAGLLLALSLVAAPAISQGDRTATFQIGDQAFKWTLSADFCLPTGSDATFAQTLAQADKQSLTSLTVVGCEGANRFEHYAIFKSPTAYLLSNIERPAILASLGAQFDKPELIAALNSGTVDEGVKKRFAEGIGIDVNVKSSFAPMGRDDVCAYLGGQSHYEAGGESARAAFVACLTTVKKRVISINVYERFVDVGTIAKLVPQAKAIAQALIRQNE